MKRLYLLCTFLIGTVCYADTETTKWYIDGQLYATTTCESGGDITLPTAPEQAGYAFDGWTPAIYDISTLDKSINGTSATRDESQHRWRVEFSYGVVSGRSLCSSTSAAQVENINTTNNSGGYCWCRAEDFIPAGSDIIYEVASPRWVNHIYNAGNMNLNLCKGYCANMCSNEVRDTASFRGDLFGSAAN